jgi:hypothetical protein
MLSIRRLQWERSELGTSEPRRGFCGNLDCKLNVRHYLLDDNLARKSWADETKVKTVFLRIVA